MKAHAWGPGYAQNKFWTLNTVLGGVDECSVPGIKAAAQADQVHVASLIQPAADAPFHFTNSPWGASRNDHHVLGNLRAHGSQPIQH